MTSYSHGNTENTCKHLFTQKIHVNIFFFHISSLTKAAQQYKQRSPKISYVLLHWEALPAEDCSYIPSPSRGLLHSPTCCPQDKQHVHATKRRADKVFDQQWRLLQNHNTEYLSCLAPACGKNTEQVLQALQLNRKVSSPVNLKRWIQTNSYRE